MIVGRAILQYASSSSDVTLICECRHCGLTVPEGTERCPDCEWAGIARYEIP